MIEVNIFIAFFAGLISFFAPCVIPLLPVYVGYITGISIKEFRENGYAKYRKKMLISSLSYVAGFSLVFVILGSAIAGLGGFLRLYAVDVQRIGGLIILILGLQMAGVFRIPQLSKSRQIVLPDWLKKLGYFRAFVIGVVFATIWSPCVGAILGSILALAAVESTAISGAFLLFVYSLGISIPFLVVSMCMVSAPKYLKFINKHIEVINKISGMVLAILGLLLVSDSYKYLNSYINQFFNKFN